MSTETNPRLQACPDLSHAATETAALLDADNYLGNFNDVPPGSSFRLIVASVVETDPAPSHEEGGELPGGRTGETADRFSIKKEYYIFRRLDPDEGHWYEWRLQARDAESEGKPVILYGATTSDRSITDIGAVTRGVDFLLAEVELYPPDLPAPEGRALLGPGILIVQGYHLENVIDASGIPRDSASP